MSVGSNFVDLRITHAGISGDSEDSVWPAFTDIMTVVVMIFLISMVTFLIRNTQLVDELQTTLIEKDQITELAHLNAAQNQSLASQLALVRQQVLALENSLQNVTNVKDQLQQTLAQREQTVQDLDAEIALLIKLRDQLSDSNSDLLSKLDLSRLSLSQTQQELSASTATKNTLNEKISLLLIEKAGLLVASENTQQTLSQSQARQVALSNKVIALTEQLRLINLKLDDQNLVLQDQSSLMASLSLNKQELEAKLEHLTDQLSQLQAKYLARGATVEDLQAQFDRGELRYKSLQQEYDSIDVKYRKLIRPARNLAGKYVVRVTYAKANGEAVYHIQQPDQTAPQTLSLSALHAKLAELKARYQQRLYTKVQIDDDSVIEFNEAWKFTQQILSQYDYYHNDTAPGTPVEASP